MDSDFLKWYVFSPLIDIVCGGIAGATGNLSGHPLDTIKLRKQILKTPKSTLQVMREIRTKEGVRETNIQLAGFFKGVEAPILATMPLNATYPPLISIECSR